MENGEKGLEFDFQINTETELQQGNTINSNENTGKLARFGKQTKLRSLNLVTFHTNQVTSNESRNDDTS